MCLPLCQRGSVWANIAARNVQLGGNPCGQFAAAHSPNTPDYLTNSFRRWQRLPTSLGIRVYCRLNAFSGGEHCNESSRHFSC